MKHLKLDIQLFADGKVVIDTDLNEKGFSSGISKMQSIAKKGFGVIAKSVGVAATAITGLIGTSVKMAGDLEQNVGGAESVFKDLGKTIDDIKFKSFQDGEGKVMSLAQVSKEAFSTMGISASDYLQNINKMGALMQGAGVKTSKALDLSGQAMQRAADVASIMGIDVNFAMESIAGAAKGNFTMMDNLGVAMNATTIEAYAVSKGIKKSYNEMDNATKVGLAMEMFLEKTEYATGNYIKENKTFAGSFNTLKAATSNFLSGAGGIEDVSNSLINFSEILVTSIGEMAPSIVEGLIGLTETLIPQIPLLMQSLMPAVLDGAISLINGLVAIFPALVEMIQTNLPTIVQSAMTIVQTLATTILSMTPQILQLGIQLIISLTQGLAQQMPALVPQIIDCILLIVETLIDNLDLIVEAGFEMPIALIEGIFNALPNLIMKLPVLIGKIVLALIKLIVVTIPQVAIKLVQTLINGLFSFWGKMINKIRSFFKGTIFEPLVNKVTDMAKIGLNFVKGLWNGINNAKQWVLDKIKGFGKSILEALKKFFKIESPSRLMRDEVGKYIAQGVGVGFEDELSSVYNDMQHAIDLETSKMSANVQTSGTYQMAMAGVPTFNLLDNTSNTTQLVCNGKVLAEVVNTENKNREVATA